MPTKEYYAKHKERYKKKCKEYNQTDQGKKSKRITDWKRMGVISQDYDKLYEYYLNTNECDNCGIELIEGFGSNRKSLDHNHKTGEFRNILCNNCNIMRPDYESD